MEWFLNEGDYKQENTKIKAKITWKIKRADHI